MTLSPGQNLGAYRIVEQIGRGGMATVYRAYQPALSRHVAIKVLPDFYADDPSFLQRFRQEAVVVASLRHPHILVVFDSGEQDGLAYIVSELIQGGTLADQLGAPLPVESSVEILKPIASALDYAHARGVIHRDVKPSNVLLNEDGTPVLSDFGIARILGNAQALTGTGVGIGTPEYMAPEQATGAGVGPTADVYALTIMAYEMLTGSVPFSADTPMAIALAHLYNPLPLPRERNPDLSEAAQDVLLKGLAKAPADRYQAAGEMVNALAVSRSSQPVAAPIVVTVAPTPGPQEVAQEQMAVASALGPDTSFRGWLTRHRLPIAGALVLAAFAAGIAVATTRGRDVSRQAEAAPAIPSVGPPAICSADAVILSSAEAALSAGAAGQAADLLASIAECPGVDVRARLEGTSMLLTASAAESAGNWDASLAQLRRLFADDAGFPGARGSLYSALVGAGRAALDTDAIDQALALCSEARGLRSDGPEAAQCVADATPPTPTAVPTLEPTPPPAATAVRPPVIAPTSLPVVVPTTVPVIAPTSPPPTAQPAGPLPSPTTRPLQGPVR